MDLLELCTSFMNQHKLLTAICALCIIVSSVAIHYKSVYSYWEKRGVNGPKPLPIFGNIHSRLIYDAYHLQNEWTKLYGKVYGIYEGTKPKLVVSDPEILRQICIKDFDLFINHAPFQYTNEYQRNFLFSLTDDHWKKVRALISPTFTSGKIKRMFRLLDTCAQDLVVCFREQLPTNGGSCRVNVKELHSLYTIDAISTCCYGLKLERSSNLKTASVRNELVRYIMAIFKVSYIRFLLMFALPDVIKNLIGYEVFPKKLFEPCNKIINQVICKRKQSGRKIDDLLQLLLDANLGNQMELDELDAQENHHAGLTKESILEDQNKLVEAAVNRETKNNKNEIADRLVPTKYGLTDLETQSNAMFFMMVGLETTGTLLANCTYVLAFHQEIQDKLYEEMKGIALCGDKSYMFDYASLTSCAYLDAFISETLRTMTNLLFTDRKASSDYYIEKYNVAVERGTTINLAYYSALNDPDYWDEPKKFNPDRFLPENRHKIVPGAYCPFGLGPRHCVGMRFSLTESKLALAKLLMNFRFEPAPGSSFPPTFTKTFGMPSMKSPFVTTIPRIVPLVQ